MNLRNLFKKKVKISKETRVFERDLNPDSLHALLRSLRDAQNKSDVYVTDLVNQEEERDAILKQAQNYLEEQGIFYIYQEGKEHAFTLSQKTLNFVAYVYLQTMTKPRSYAVNLILETYGLK